MKWALSFRARVRQWWASLGFKGMILMSEVFLLWHTHRFPDGDDDEKLIGVYSAREKAQAAIERVAGKPGFADQPEGFEICPYELDLDHWTEGYITC
jgi:hypothetical protein